VPKLLVPDNTRVAVIKACLYEPQVNRTYAEMAAHHNTAVLPARPRRRRHKAKAGVAVLIIERWLLGRLRRRRFYRIQRSASYCGSSMTSDRSGGLGSPAERSSTNSTGRTSTRCRQSRIFLPSGVSVGPASTTMSSSTVISTASPYRFARSEVEVRLTPRAVEI
jgi:hypothetical protein